MTAFPKFDHSVVDAGHNQARQSGYRAAADGVVAAALANEYQRFDLAKPTACACQLYLDKQLSVMLCGKTATPPPNFNLDIDGVGP